MEYDLELEKVIDKIKTKKAKRVLVQLPDGLKMQAVDIVDFIEEKTDAEVHLWSGSNYGGCDLPVLPKEMEYDLVVHFGHNEF